jgi:hypothetical protein
VSQHHLKWLVYYIIQLSPLNIGWENIPINFTHAYTTEVFAREKRLFHSGSYLVRSLRCA